MNKKDIQLLSETYTQSRVDVIDEKIRAYEAGEITKEQLIDEGIWDQMKARAAGVGGALKGAGSYIKGAAQSAVGKAAGALGAKDAGAQLSQMGQQSRAAASGQYSDAKLQNIKNTWATKIQKDIHGFAADLTALGLTPDKIAETNPELSQALDNLGANVRTIIATLDAGLLNTQESPNATVAAGQQRADQRAAASGSMHDVDSDI